MNDLSIHETCGFKNVPGVSPGFREAVALQKALACKVIRENRLGEIQRVAGADVSVRGDTARAAIAVLSFPGLELMESATSSLPVHFPYITGLLTFREGPAIIRAFEALKARPDILIFDGQGIAHPRRFGLASHMGVILDVPSIGCAKTRLCGYHEPLHWKKGSCVPLLDGDEIVGAVLRTRDYVKPVYISIGHRIDLKTSVDTVLTCCRKFRLPETTRAAHRMAGRK